MRGVSAEGGVGRKIKNSMSKVNLRLDGIKQKIFTLCQRHPLRRQDTKRKSTNNFSRILLKVLQKMKELVFPQKSGMLIF